MKESYEERPSQSSWPRVMHARGRKGTGVVLIRLVGKLSRTISETQTFNSASSGNWAGNFTPRQKRVSYTYNVDSTATVSRSEYDGGFQHFVDASYGYFADGRAMSVSYNTSEFSPSINTTIHHTATVSQSFYSNGQLASVTRTAVHDSANLKKIDELIKFAYNANGQLQSQTTSYVPPPNSTVRQPGPTSTRDPKFDTTPGGRIADDNQFTYKYDKEGNLIERVSKFSPITIDDLDSSVYATTTSWFSSQAGNIPISTTAPEQ